MFEKSLKEGEYGEHTVWNLLQKQPKVRNVIDVRECQKHQQKDIDFLVETINRQFYSVEVKSDYKAQESGNMVYEFSTNGGLGCFERTEADYIFYVIPKNREVHVVNVKALRQYVRKKRPDEIRMGDCATGFLLPIQDLIKNKVIKYTYTDVY